MWYDRYRIDIMAIQLEPLGQSSSFTVRNNGRPTNANNVNI